MRLCSIYSFLLEVAGANIISRHNELMKDSSLPCESGTGLEKAKVPCSSSARVKRASALPAGGF